MSTLIQPRNWLLRNYVSITYNPIIEKFCNLYFSLDEMRQNELNVHETLRKAQLKNMRHVYSELSNTKSLIDDAIESKYLIFFVCFLIWPFWNFQWAFWGPESGPVAKHFVIFIKKKVFYFYIFVIQPCHAPDVITNWCYLIYFWYIKILFKWLRRISRLKMTCTTSQPWPSHVLSQPAHPPR